MNNMRINEIRSQYQIRWDDDDDDEQGRAEWYELDMLYLRFIAAGLTLQACVGRSLVAM